MIDYGTPPGQRRPGRKRARGRNPLRLVMAALVLVVSVGAVLVVGHVLTGRTAPAPQPAAHGSYSTTAEPLRLGACIDPTLSIERSFAPAIRADLAAGIGHLTPPTGPPTTGTATAPRPALSLLVREVNTTSFSSDPGPYTAQVDVPGVPGLSRPRPVPSDANYATDLAAWSQGAQTVKAERKAAAAAVSERGPDAGRPAAGPEPCEQLGHHRLRIGAAGQRPRRWPTFLPAGLRPRGERRARARGLLPWRASLHRADVRQRQRQPPATPCCSTSRR